MSGSTAQDSQFCMLCAGHPISGVTTCLVGIREQGLDVPGRVSIRRRLDGKFARRGPQSI